MFAKLFARITESSLMEEDIETRYVFVMLLAIADPRGIVIGTDVALSRRFNMPVADFRAAIARLMAPDPDSNSRVQDGRRIVRSDGERGYKIVNYVSYRNIRDEDHRREYMRDYMAKRRAEQPVNSVNSRKQQLAQEEEEGEKQERESGAERPSWEEVKFQADKIGLAAWKARDWFEEMAGCGWLDYRSRPIRDWRAVLHRVRTKWEADGRPMTPPVSTRQQSTAPKNLRLDHSKGF